MPGEAGDLLDADPAVAQQADERGPQLARRPALPGPGRGADALEHLPDVSRVQRGAQMVREHQPGVLPAIPAATRRPGCRPRHAAPGPPPREGRGSGGTVRSWSRRAPGPTATRPRAAAPQAWRPGRRPGRHGARARARASSVRIRSSRLSTM